MRKNPIELTHGIFEITIQVYERKIFQVASFVQIIQRKSIILDSREMNGVQERLFIIFDKFSKSRIFILAVFKIEFNYFSNIFSKNENNFF